MTRVNLPYTNPWLYSSQQKNPYHITDSRTYVLRKTEIKEFKNWYFEEHQVNNFWRDKSKVRFKGMQLLMHQLRVHGGLCNPSHWDIRIGGWLKGGSGGCWCHFGDFFKPWINFNVLLMCRFVIIWTVVIIPTCLIAHIRGINCSCYLVLGSKQPWR